MIGQVIKYVKEIRDAAKYMLQGLSVTLDHMGRSCLLYTSINYAWV